MCWYNFSLLKSLISAAQASPKKAEELSPLSDSEESGDAPVASTSSLRVPQTPAKLPSFAKPTQSSLAKTPAALRSPVKPSFGSPTKLARSTTLVTRPAIPRSAPALQRSATHESVLCSKAGPSSARPNEANPVGKCMLTGRGKPIFPNKTTCKASQKTPLAAVPGSPVRLVIDLTEDEESSESDNRARLVLLRARTKDDELKEILDNTLNRKEASPEVEQPMMRVSTAEAFDNLREAAQAMAPPATPPRTGLRSASSTIPPSAALATVRPAEGDAEEEFPSDDEDVDDGDLIDDKNYHGASKKRKGGLMVLSHVRAFVDVRDAHTSRDSGEAFVEFLEQLGAKVFKKFTKTCTHIVFKNGSFNTVSKWKAAETKPLVVRLSWVTECVNKKEHVVEDEHLLDISGLFPSGVDPKVRCDPVWAILALTELTSPMDLSSKPLEIARQRS
ncbi:hypothetical protein BDZ89DRAFT_1079679 [Hymenopellis radicata]|nr:hypothetical protein BDZ89DRAFT_1079679 [Hymenopellis radicata]